MLQVGVVLEGAVEGEHARRVVPLGVEVNALDRELGRGLLGRWVVLEVNQVLLRDVHQ